MKTVHLCENCNSLWKTKEKIKICPECKMDVCPKCDDYVVCSITRTPGHKDCFMEEGGEYYLPHEHEEKACKKCGLIYCDCGVL